MTKLPVTRMPLQAVPLVLHKVLQQRRVMQVVPTVLRPQRMNMRVLQVQAPVKLVPMQTMQSPVPVTQRVSQAQPTNMQAPPPQLLPVIRRIAGSSRMQMRLRVLLRKQIAMQAWPIVPPQLVQRLPVMPVTKLRPLVVPMLSQAAPLRPLMPTRVLQPVLPRLVTAKLLLATPQLQVRLQAAPRVLSPLPVMPPAKQLPMIH